MDGHTPLKTHHNLLLMIMAVHTQLAPSTSVAPTTSTPSALQVYTAVEQPLAQVVLQGTTALEVSTRNLVMQGPSAALALQLASSAPEGSISPTLDKQVASTVPQISTAQMDTLSQVRNHRCHPFDVLEYHSILSQDRLLAPFVPRAVVVLLAGRLAYAMLGTILSTPSPPMVRATSLATHAMQEPTNQTLARLDASHAPQAATRLSLSLGLLNTAFAAPLTPPR